MIFKDCGRSLGLNIIFAQALAKAEAEQRIDTLFNTAWCRAPKLRTWAKTGHAVRWRNSAVARQPSGFAARYSKRLQGEFAIQASERRRKSEKALLLC